MNLFHLPDHFKIIPGLTAIAVGAPHHGTRPNVDADQGTGPIALALAAKLESRAVVVSDLRRTVDVNKNPLGLGRTVRRQAIRYQNELFYDFPRLVIEIHRHVSGRYAVELTTSFDLDATSEGDARFLEKLAALKQTLPAALATRLGQRPTVGVYPLDRDVTQTATNTFTFQKIRRARNLVGLDCYGLHIELSAALRTTQQARSPAHIDALAEALAVSLREAFYPLPSVGATIPTRSGNAAEAAAPFSLSLKAIHVPARFTEENIVLVHPDALDSLGALDGDAVIIQNGGEALRSTIQSSVTVRHGQAALSARLRRQVGLADNSHHRITIVRIQSFSPVPAGEERGGGRVQPYYIFGKTHPEQEARIWLSPVEIDRIGLIVGASVSLYGQPGIPPVHEVLLQADATLPLRIAVVSENVANRLVLTLGEVIKVEGMSGES